MGRTDFGTMRCSIARTMEVIGDPWSLLILRDAFYGVRRFDDLQADLGIARNILAERLRKLVERGVLERRPYQERPTRFEYRLTTKGRDLLPLLLEMMRWGDRWEGDGAPPVRVHHLTCDRVTEARATCAHCRGELRLGEIRVDPLPIRLPASAR